MIFKRETNLLLLNIKQRQYTHPFKNDTSNTNKSQKYFVEQSGQTLKCILYPFIYMKSAIRQNLSIVIEIKHLLSSVDVD